MKSTCNIKLCWPKTPTHNPPVSINKECGPLKDICLSTKRTNEEHSPVKGNVSQKKSNNKASPPKTLQLKLNKEDWGVNLLHELHYCGMT